MLNNNDLNSNNRFFRLIKPFALFFVTFLILTSCLYKKEIKTNIYYRFHNYSNHKIVLVFYDSSNVMADSFNLVIDRPRTYRYTKPEEVSDYYFHYESYKRVEIFYDDTIKVSHENPASNPGPIRNILIPLNWEMTTSDGVDYSYNYRFTNDDYLEALTLQ